MQLQILLGQAVAVLGFLGAILALYTVVYQWYTSSGHQAPYRATRALYTFLYCTQWHPSPPSPKDGGRSCQHHPSHSVVCSFPPRSWAGAPWALLHQRVRRVFYAIPDTTNGALGGRFRLHGLEGLNHRYDVYHVKLPHDLEAAAASSAPA